MNNKKKNSFAIAGLIFGFVSIFIPFLSILAIIFSSIGILKLKEYGGNGKYYAVLGLVLGFFTTIILITHMIDMMLN